MKKQTSSPPTSADSMVSLRVALAHARYQAIESFRIPMAGVTSTIVPVLALLIFVMVDSHADTALSATTMTIQLLLFSTTTTVLLVVSYGIAAERGTTWAAFIRSLPIGLAPRLLGRLLAPLPHIVITAIPLLLGAIFITEASSSWRQAIFATIAILVGALPIFAAALALGYWLPKRAAQTVAQSLFIPISILGGLFISPENFPQWLNTISLYTPVRAARDLAVAVTTGGQIQSSTLICLTAWTVALAAIAWLGLVRDRNHRPQ